MIILAEGIGKDFTREGLKDISFRIGPGRFTLITGESGTGKTTLLNIAGGMLHPDRGRVFVDGRDLYREYTRKERIRLLGSDLGYMMQGVSLIPSLTVKDNITYPLALTGRKYDNEKFEQILKRLGIYEVKDSYPGRISGGEYRRVLLAGVLLSEPKILFCDEPTSNLDSDSAAIVTDMLYSYVKPDRSVVVATHDTAFDRADDHVELRRKTGNDIGINAD